MKTYIIQFTLVLAIAIQGQAQSAEFFEKADAFFKKNVSKGLVDYKGINADPSALNQLTSAIAKADLSKSSDNEKKAFYVNAYNILVIKNIIDRYPTKSPLKINGFFDKIKNEVAGENLTLNELEKGKLLAKTQDARLHFVLVCAAVSCPKIADFAYLPDQIEKQMESQTRLALNDESFIRSGGKKVLVSEIFNWYAKDFEREAGSILAYINKYRDQKFSANSPVGIYTYDWSLNTL